MIKIGNLTNKKGDNKYIFSDLHLDLQTTKTSSSWTNDNVVEKNDIVADLDLAAIKNSLRNILTQTRYLVPKFGINLKKYIGQPISEIRAQVIGDEIDRGIKIWEPRIDLKQIYVIANVDEYLYNIVIIISLPNFSNKEYVLGGILGNKGDFQFINQ